MKNFLHFKRLETHAKTNTARKFLMAINHMKNVWKTYNQNGTSRFINQVPHHLKTILIKSVAFINNDESKVVSLNRCSGMFGRLINICSLWFLSKSIKDISREGARGL